MEPHASTIPLLCTDCYDSAWEHRFQTANSYNATGQTVHINAKQTQTTPNLRRVYLTTGQPMSTSADILGAGHIHCWSTDLDGRVPLSALASRNCPGTLNSVWEGERRMSIKLPASRPPAAFHFAQIARAMQIAGHWQAVDQACCWLDQQE